MINDWHCIWEKYENISFPYLTRMAKICRRNAFYVMFNETFCRHDGFWYAVENSWGEKSLMKNFCGLAK
jgi:hypothetical protein